MTAPAPRTAVIIGSGAWHVFDLAAGMDLAAGRVRETPFGPSRPIAEIRLPGGREVLALTRHGEKGYSLGAWAVNYRANIWALKDMGADAILSTTACGGVDPSLAPGEFVVPHDVLDHTARRPRTFFENSGLGVLRMSDPLCPSLRAALAAALEAEGVVYRPRGVVACTDGPRLETPAEVRAYAAEGATLVGMTVAPEFALARELQMCYATVSWVVNPAEGVRDRPYRPDVLFEGMATAEEAEAADRAAERLPAILAAAVAALAPERPCHCRRAMQRYIDRGDIGPDFHTWITPGGASGKGG
jgi:5'-methylthioadenosine phosphorylase